MKPIAQLLKPHHHPDALRVSPTATVYAALELMSERGVGALMAMDGDKLVGIFSERDYCRKVALKGRNSKDTLVADVMTSEVFCVAGNTGTRACMLVMRDKHFRHLPVVDGGKVLGLVSMRDIMDDVVSDHEQTISHLESYINS